MQSTTPTRRVILEGVIDRSVIRGTLTDPTGERREFHGWLELNTALEAILDRRGGTPATGANEGKSRKVSA